MSKSSQYNTNPMCSENNHKHRVCHYDPLDTNDKSKASQSMASHLDSHCDVSNKNKLKILLLGDGDFSWSFDFARYVKKNLTMLNNQITKNCMVSNTIKTNGSSDENSRHRNKINSLWPPSSLNYYNCVEICATGIDSEKEIEQKYPHSKSFIIPKLLKLNNNQSTVENNKVLVVQVKHNINAITQQTNYTQQVSENILTANTTTSRYDDHYDIVMFHHPHLGVEDCKLHNQFLHHFFYSVRNFWWYSSSSPSSSASNNNKNENMKLLYITLASGQYERWKCKEAAVKHQFHLLHRCHFIAQPAIKADEDNNRHDTELHFPQYYEHRRHQTGKSFAKRVQGNSETFIYTDALQPTSQIPIDLPWFVMTSQLPIVHSESDNITCPYCQKTFRETRSLKNHIQTKHGNTCDALLTTRIPSTNDQEDKMETASPKRMKSDPTDQHHFDHISEFSCLQCFSNGNPRMFSSHEGLRDHMKAKHNAIHPNLSSDDATSRSLTEINSQADHCETNDGNSNTSWICKICDYSITRTTTDETTIEQDHWQQFIPVEVGISSDKYTCQFCRKTFNQKRALLQHENFCSFRSTTPNE
jgi:Domain of unknown function (DUF2431)/Zinc finger, C2H2 type